MIRQGKKEDAPKIAEIKINNWRKTYLNILPDNFLESLDLPHEEKKYINNLESKNVLVYEDKEPVAYCYYGSREDSNIFPEYTAEIFALYVKNDCQCNGIGTKLLQNAIHNLSKENNKILLWCAKQNTRAISFYQKNGFKIIGENVEYISGKAFTKVALGINIKNEEPIFYTLKKSANYIENEDSIAIYTNPDLIFLKDKPRVWFKKIINQEDSSDIPQKFVNYLLEKDVIEVCK